MTSRVLITLILLLSATARSETVAGEASADVVQKKGQVVLSLRADEAGATTPFIAGDFTDWKPLPMQRYRKEWRFIVSIPRGVYRFAFRSGDGRWFVPPGFPNRSDDHMGGWVAVLVVL